MKSERIERAALAAVAGVRRTPQEIETAAYLADFAAACKAHDETPVDVRQERVQAVRDMLVRAKDAEAVRAAYWLRAPLSARMVAVMSARLPKDRASDALNKFDAMELETIQKCMNGGNSTTPGMTAPDKAKVMNGALH